MTILLADDHGLFRDSLSQWLATTESGFRVKTASTLDEARKCLQRDRAIRLLMLDLCMPGMNGSESIRSILDQWPDLRILVISANENTMMIRRCIQSGASGFAPKSLNGEALLDAIRIVLDGHIYLPKGIRLVDAGDDFTERQLDILRMLAEGDSNREIAGHLHLAESTVKQYVSDILNRLGVDNRIKAGLRARQLLGMGN